MAFTEDDLETLDSAIKRGVRTVTTSDGKSVTYGSVDEMLRIRRLMQSELAGSSAVPASHSVARIGKTR
jgi:hypothetical protein